MRLYYLQRNVDETGNSGIGRIAEVVEFSDGWCALHWSAKTNALGVSSTIIYQSLADVVEVHGHGGLTVLVPAEL